MPGIKSFIPKILLCLLIINFNVYGQDDSTFVKKLIPRSFVAQYAGSIGLASVGIYYPLKKDKLGLSFYYGYVPESAGGRLDIISSKLKYQPFAYEVVNNIKLFPINPVFFTSYTLNEGFHLLWPKDKYGDRRFYWWSSALRLHLGLSSDIHFENVGKNNSLTIYFEGNITDLYFTSYFKNPDHLSVWQTIRFGTGLRLDF